MDEKNVLSPEEEKSEREALVEAKEEEVRAAVITEFGFDEVDDADRISKAVAKEMEHRKSLSQAIGQKIKYRTEAQKVRDVIPPKPLPSEELDKELDNRVGAKVNETLEKRDLDALDYPDDLKTEISRIAKITNVSVKQALKDPYIESKIQTYEESKASNEKLEKATVGRTNKSSGRKVFSFENPPDVDMATEEGRKEWDKYKAEMIKQGY